MTENQPNPGTIDPKDHANQVQFRTQQNKIADDTKDNLSKETKQEIIDKSQDQEQLTVISDATYRRVKEIQKQEDLQTRKEEDEKILADESKKSIKYDAGKNGADHPLENAFKELMQARAEYAHSKTLLVGKEESPALESFRNNRAEKFSRLDVLRKEFLRVLDIEMRS